MNSLSMRYPDVAHKPVSEPSPPEGITTAITTSQVITNRYTGSHTMDVDYIVKRNPPSESYGAASGGQWSPISDSTQSKPGDILRFTYRLKLGWFQKYQSDYFLWKLQRDPRFELRHYSLNEEEQRLWIEVKVKQNFSPVLAIAVAVAGLAVGIGIMLSVESIEKLGTIEIGSNRINLAPILIAGVLAVILGKMFGGK